MPDVTADAAGLRAALRDDIARAAYSTNPLSDIRSWEDVGTYTFDLYLREADAVVARLDDAYELDAWLTHLAAERAEEVRG